MDACVYVCACMCLLHRYTKGAGTPGEVSLSYLLCRCNLVSSRPGDLSQCDAAHWRHTQTHTHLHTAKECQITHIHCGNRMMLIHHTFQSNSQRFLTLDSIRFQYQFPCWAKFASVAFLQMCVCVCVSERQREREMEWHQTRQTELIYRLLYDFSASVQQPAPPSVLQHQGQDVMTERNFQSVGVSNYVGVCMLGSIY